MWSTFLQVGTYARLMVGTLRDTKASRMSRMLSPPLHQIHRNNGIVDWHNLSSSTDLIQAQADRVVSKSLLFQGAGSSPRSCNVYCALMLRPMPYFFLTNYARGPFRNAHTEKNRSGGGENLSIISFCSEICRSLSGFYRRGEKWENAATV